jgi:hypothetical protein
MGVAAWAYGHTGREAVLGLKSEASAACDAGLGVKFEVSPGFVL